MDYLTTQDIHLLRTKGFEPGFSGESWFGVDKEGNTWQAYVVEGDLRITFVSSEDRTSVFMERDKFENLFGDV